jgi:uncharacterized protein
VAPRRASDLSAAEARRIALAAQGFGQARPAGRIDARHFGRVLDTVGLLQIDSVNVLARAHYMPLFSRLGAYDQRAFDRYAWGSGRMFEYWGHEASLIPVERYGLFRHRMDGAFGRTMRNRERLRSREETVRRVMAEVRERGPVIAGDVHEGERRSGWWEWGDAKVVLEALYTTGDLAIGDRRNFARLYDLPERVLPSEALAGPHPPEDEAQRELMALAARHHGVGTAADLADYYRLPLTPAKRRLEELADAGRLERVAVEGWDAPAYLDPQARVPRRVEARALLSPFDPVTWNRDRAERLFGFHYRIEIYTPADKRQYGYYVLPFLLGEDLVARVDLKADRQAGALLVQAAHLEPGRDAPATASALAEELRLVAHWLGLDRIVIAPRGDLAGELSREFSP